MNEFTYAFDKTDYSCLSNGDCVSQEVFHIAYDRMSTGFRAELIGGTVFVSEPVSLEHAHNDSTMSTILRLYQAETKGTNVGNNATVVLGHEDEVQPDVFLRISPNCGGQSTDIEGNDKRRYVLGAPELVVEVAHSTRAIDLHLKRRRYAKSGVCEYIVFCLEPRTILWFDLKNDRNMDPDAEGIIRSEIFPGLWINGPALLKDDLKTVIITLNEGIASPQHTKFVAKLK